MASRPALLLGAAVLQGCLLLAEPPDFGACVDEELEVGRGTTTLAAPTEPSGCASAGELGDPVVVAWTAPASTTYVFRVSSSAQRGVAVAVTDAACSISDACALLPAKREVTRAMSEGEEVYVWATGAAAADETITLEIKRIDVVSGCPYAGDGECDEPEGSGLCPEGSDPDC